MVDVSLSNKILFKVSKRCDTPYRYVCFSRIKATTNKILALSLLSNVNERMSLVRRSLGTKTWNSEVDSANSSSNPWVQSSVPTVSCYVSSSLSTKTRLDTYPSDSIQPTSTKPWSNSEDWKLNKSSSGSITCQWWMTVYREYMKLCVIMNNLDAQTAVSDWIRLEFTELPECLWKTLYNLKIWRTALLSKYVACCSKSTEFIYRCFTRCYDM